MAMSHVQPMLLLLVSLFFLPALRGAIDFEYCASKYLFVKSSVTFLYDFCVFISL